MKCSYEMVIWNVNNFLFEYILRTSHPLEKIKENLALSYQYQILWFW